MGNSMDHKTLEPKPPSPAPEPPELTLSQFRDWMRGVGYAERSISCYLQELKALAAWLAARGGVSFLQLSSSLVSQFQAALAARPGRKGGVLSVRTRHRILSAVVCFSRWMTKSKRIAEDPTADLSLPRAPRLLPDNVLTVKEMERLLSAPALDGPEELRDRALMELLYATGLRSAEALDLRLEDIDLAGREVRVRRGKGGQGRVVPLCRETAAVISAYVAQARPALTRADDSGLLFASRAGTRLDPSTMNKRFKRYAQAAGIKRSVGFHTFRHSVATHLMQRGAAIRYIQEFLGHRCITATEIYTRVTIPDLKAAHAKYHPRERMEV